MGQQDLHKGYMLDGIWPGNHDIQCLTRLVNMHFSGDLTAYLSFAQLGETRRNEDPDAVVLLNAWLPELSEEGGGNTRCTWAGGTFFQLWFCVRK